jgi:hypothetical protein
MHSYQAEGYGRIHLRSHYLRYLGIDPPDDLRITSYYDKCNLLNRKEDFHIPDVDSTSLYLKPHHDDS